MTYAKLLPLFILSSIAGTAAAQQGAASDQQPESVTSATGSVGSLMSDRATFLFSDERIHDEPLVLWEGFLNGMRGFEHFYNPVGNPIYFESPLIQTQARLLFLHHTFGSGSLLGGGDLNIWALQLRVALTDRLAFIATKDGYSQLNADILPENEGWNDVAVGLKYALIVDKPADFITTIGFRWMLDNGGGDILQSGVNEISPFVSIAKGFDKLHLMASITDRIPTNLDDGNNVLQWDLHVDYEIFKGIAPIFEIHGLHYLSDGDRTPLSVGGLDYTNLGSTNVAGTSVVWGGVGARIKFSPHMSLGATYEFPITDPDDDIFGDRVTIDFEFTW